MKHSNSRICVDITSQHEEVTGSLNCVLARFPNRTTVKFFVDAGLFQEKDYEELNNVVPREVSSFDFGLVTHLHVDHIGRLPIMIKEGFKNEIYTTEGTRNGMQIALDDCLKLQLEKAKKERRKSLYSQSDVSKTLSLVRSCEYGKTVKVHEHVRVTFLMNGHLPDASMILIQISYPGCNAVNILFTGDYNNKNAFFTVKDIPKWILELPLIVVQESTYGDMDSTEIKPCFKENILKCVRNGGTAIVPVFSLSRKQEVLQVLKNMQDNKELSFRVPIYHDGKLGFKYDNLYIGGGFTIDEDKRNFYPKNLTRVDDTNRNSIMSNEDVKIIVTTSGMGSYGPAQAYLPAYISRKNALIQFTGYTAEGTMGRALKDTPYNATVVVCGILKQKIADVEYTNEFSAHAKADEMIEFLKKFKNLKLVLVNHGEKDVKELFAKRILKEVKVKDVGILGCGYTFRIDGWGLRKTVPTNFI